MKKEKVNRFIFLYSDGGIQAKPQDSSTYPHGLQAAYNVLSSGSRSSSGAGASCQMDCHLRCRRERNRKLCRRCGRSVASLRQLVDESSGSTLCASGATLWARRFCGGAVGTSNQLRAATAAQCPLRLC